VIFDTTSVYTATVLYKEYIPPCSKPWIITPLAPHSGKETFTGEFPRLSSHVKGLKDSGEPWEATQPRQSRSGYVLSPRITHSPPGGTQFSC